MERTITTVSLVWLVLCLGGCTSDEPVDEPSLPPEQPTAPAATGIPPQHADHIVELFNKGIGLMDQFRAREAVEAFEEMVRLAPGWPTGRVNLGIALLNSPSDEHLTRAEKELRWAIEQDPDNAFAHYALGMLLRHLTRFDEAAELFQGVLRIDPDDADAHYQLGILIEKKDPQAARIHLEHTLERIPHHESACYHLHTLLRRAGQKKRAGELLSRFQSLKQSGASVFSSMKYGQMGRYAEVIRTLDEQFADPGVQPHVPPDYADVAKPSGLMTVAGGTAAWPGESQGQAESFGPGIAVADVDGDGRLDLYVPGVAADTAGTLYRGQGPSFVADADSGIDGRSAVGAYFGDYDADGDPDLFLTCAGPNRLYRNDGSGRFSDVTESAGIAAATLLSVGASWADADHDGDLDLYVANFSRFGPDASGSTGAPNVLWRNNGNGSFTDVAVTAGIDGGMAPTVSVAFFDVDDDHDLDLYLINHRATNRLFFNDRVGRYREATSQFPELADDGPGLGAVLGDVDLNGREDLLLIRGSQPPRLFLRADRGRFVEDAAFAAAAEKLGGAVGALLGDLDLDGDLDLVLLAAGSNGHAGHYVLMNRGTGRFDPAVRFAGQPQLPNTRGAVAADLDGDGGLELVVARAGAQPELWRQAAAPSRRWLEVIPARDRLEKALRIEPSAVGLFVEIKTGHRLQVASVKSSSGFLGSPPAQVHFGLGDAGKCDYVRLAWPDAVFQGELEVPADQRWSVVKIQRKASSCPILFSFDGRRFAFVTDFLGGGGLGFFVEPGIRAPPDPTEDVRIPPVLIAPRAGRYLLRVAEPLEEVTYFDQLHLLAYDHPSDWELYPDERFGGSPPSPNSPPLAVAEKVFPVSASNERRQDMLERIIEIDRRYVEPPLDPRFVGYADDHWVELDFGDQLRRFGPRDRLVLYMYGWTEYTYSHVNYAAHQAGVTMQGPSIEVPGENGDWRVAVSEAGFPAGLPRMMTLDVSALPIRRQGRLRIRSNMEIFWDQIFLARDAAAGEIRRHVLRPTVAVLRPLGYPREYSPDGFDPTMYDYHRRDGGVAFRNLTGYFTRFGDVRTLLESADDRFAIMGRGEEIALEFDATELPGLSDGWSRTLVLHSDGYCKDMDLYTAYPDTVEPLPFHAMKNYPPTEKMPGRPTDDAYRRTWNTRHIRGNR